MEYFTLSDDCLFYNAPKPSDARQRQEMFLLREELAQQLAELIWLTYHTVPQYLIRYGETYGAEELTLIRLRSQLAYTRRLIARIRERQLRGKAVHFETLVRQMEQEPAAIEAQEEINAYEQRLYNAKLYQQYPILTPEQCDEMRRSVRSLLTLLHPYLNADYDEMRKEMLERMTSACNRSQPEELWILELEVREAQIVPFEQREDLTPESIQENIPLLREKLEETQRLLTRLQREFPLSEQEMFDNPALLAEHQKNIRSEIQKKQATLGELEQTLRQLLDGVF